MKQKPIVELLHITPLHIAAHAIRQCHDTQDQSDTEKPPASLYNPTCCEGYIPKNEAITGPKDKALIHRVGCKLKHASTLEHIIVQLDISNISRALLQEFARHRVGISPTVKSSRYTLGELKGEESFAGPYCDISDGMGNQTTHWDTLQARASKYVMLTGNEVVDSAIIQSLERLRQLIKQGISNDIAKYALPDAYKTSLTCTVNFRSLQNLLYLRSAPSALAEFRALANAIFETIPQEYQYLLEDSMYKEK